MFRLLSLLAAAVLGTVYGPISVLLALLGEVAATSLLGNPPKVVMVTVVAPLVEELSKGLSFLAVPRVASSLLRLSLAPVARYAGPLSLNRAVEFLVDAVRGCGGSLSGAITLAATTALGFATIENFFYALGSLKLGPLAPIVVGVTRTFVSLPVHVLATVTFAFLYGFGRKVGVRWAGALAGYASAAMVHAAFNFLVLYLRCKVAHGV